MPWHYAGKEVWVREQGGDVEVRYGAELIARHAPAIRRHQVVTRGQHHEGIPLGNKQTGKMLIHIQQSAPVSRAAAAARLSRLRSAIHEQGRRHDSGEDRLRLSAGGESTLELLLLSERAARRRFVP